MKIHLKAALGALLVSGALVMVVMSGCAPAQPPSQQASARRWEVFGTQSGAFLVNTETGESYVFIPQALSWAAIQRVAVQFAPPPPGTITPEAGTPTGTLPTPSPTPPPAPAP